MNSQDSPRRNRKPAVTTASNDAIESEVYHSLSATMRENKFDVGRLLAQQLNLKPDVMAESKTWTARPDPWVISLNNGQVGLTINRILVTAIRAQDTSGVLHCYLTIAERWTVGWGATRYRDNLGIPFQFSYENNAGGRLRWWDQGRIHSVCGMNQQVMNFSEAFEPDIYDIFTGWTRYAGVTLFSQC